LHQVAALLPVCTRHSECADVSVPLGVLTIEDRVVSKQLTYYMLKSDEREFEDFILSRLDVVLLGFANLTEEPTVLHRFPTEDTPTVRYLTLFLWKKGFPLFLRHVEMATGALAGKSLHYVDAIQSSVIEVSRSMMLDRGNTLSRGRFWAEMRRLEGDQFIDKGTEFHEWYDLFANWIRKRFRRTGGHPVFYAGDHAYEWYRSGGKFQS
jgi:hypothetical protein